MTDLRIEPSTSPDDAAAIGRELLAFNEVCIGPADEQPLQFVVRDDAGHIVGGLVGVTRWQWLYVAKLWLDERLRGRGLGTTLLQMAEDEARRRGCIGASLDTFEHQARPFYEKLGWELFGTLEGYPAGTRQYFLRKTL